MLYRRMMHAESDTTQPIVMLGTMCNANGNEFCPKACQERIRTRQTPRFTGLLGLTDERMRKVTWLVWEQGIFTWALKKQELTLSVWDGVRRIPTPDL
jgi:hypothetical protein